MPALRHYILGVLLVAVLLLTPLRIVRVTGNSMFPTLKDGSTYVLDLAYWRPRGLRQGDVVVLDRGEERWVKRLIGLPGDRLQITVEQDAWISFVANLTVDPALRRTNAPLGGELREETVAADEVFVIGDNLNHSADSTNRQGGIFKLTDVVGVVRTFGFRRDFPFRDDRAPR